MKPDPGKRSFDSALHAVLLVLGICVLLFSVSAACAVSDEDVISATFHYSGASKEQQTITIEYSDEWLLRPDNEYNHKLM